MSATFTSCSDKHSNNVCLLVFKNMYVRCMFRRSIEMSRILWKAVYGWCAVCNVLHLPFLFSSLPARNLVKITPYIFRTNVNYFIQMYRLTKFRIQNESLRRDIALSQTESLAKDYSARAYVLFFFVAEKSSREEFSLSFSFLSLAIETRTKNTWTKR